MPTYDSQDSDVSDVGHPAIKLFSAVPEAVRHACRNDQIARDELEDLVQNVLVLLIEDDYRRLRSFGGRSKIETWLHTVIRHCAGQHLRKRWREKENVSMDDLSPDALSYQSTQEETLIDEDERKTLRAIIGSLPERKQRLMDLWLQELKPAEIAKEMGITINSVYSEKSAAFKEIRELTEEG